MRSNPARQRYYLLGRYGNNAFVTADWPWSRIRPFHSRLSSLYELEIKQLVARLEIHHSCVWYSISNKIRKSRSEFSEYPSLLSMRHWKSIYHRNSFSLSSSFFLFFSLKFLVSDRKRLEIFFEFLLHSIFENFWKSRFESGNGSKNRETAITCASVAIFREEEEERLVSALSFEWLIKSEILCRA